ncbi:hypothetical protein L1887_56237 [Cichorium endivia]|nr:hypothetical protein L1887_56237 [Cichorium endivia]
MTTTRSLVLLVVSLVLLCLSTAQAGPGVDPASIAHLPYQYFHEDGVGGTNAACWLSRQPFPPTEGVHCRFADTISQVKGRQIHQCSGEQHLFCNACHDLETKLTDPKEQVAWKCLCSSVYASNLQGKGGKNGARQGLHMLVLGGGLLLVEEKVARDELAHLFDRNHGRRDPDDRLDLVDIEPGHLEPVLEERHGADGIVQSERQRNGADEQRILPGPKGEQRVGLADGIERIEHLDHHEHRQRNRRRLPIRRENPAVDALEEPALGLGGGQRTLVEMRQLRIRDLRPTRVEHKPPRIAKDGRRTHKRSHQQVARKDPARDERVVARARLLAHDARRGRIEAQRGRRQTIRHKVDPQQLHGDQRLGQSQHHRQEDRHHLANVARDEVADKALHVVEDRSALLHGRLDGGKVVVRQHHVRRQLGHVGAGTHGDTNVGLLERGRVVDAVAGHGDHEALALEQVDELRLVRGLDAREEAGARHGGEPVVARGERVEFAAGERLAVERLGGVKDADLAADGLGGVLVVSGDDDDADARLAAALDGGAHLGTRRVEHADEADERHLLLKLHVLGGAAAAVRLDVQRHVLLDGEGERAQAEAAVLEHLVADLGAEAGVERLRLFADQHRVAALDDALGRALDEQAAGGGGALDERRHALAVAAELESEQTRVRLAVLVGDGAGACVRIELGDAGVDGGVVVAELLDKHLESGLGGLADDGVVGVVIEMHVRVVADGRHFGEGVEGGAGLVEAGDDLAVGVRDVADGGKGAAGDRVVCEGAGGADDGEVGDAHLVGGEGAGLVGADDVGGAEGLYGREVAYDGVLLCHLFGAEGEAGGDDGGEALGDGGDGEGDGDLEVVHGAAHPAVVGGVVEVAEVDDPDEDADDGDDLGEEFAKVVELLLERRLFVVVLGDFGVDVADGGACAGECDDGEGGAVGDGGAGEEDVGLVLLDGVGVDDGVERLVDRDGLAGEDGLVYAEGGGVDGDEAAVCGDLVADGEDEDVAGDEELGAHLVGVGVADDGGGVGAVLFEGVDGLVGVALLDDAYGRICDEDEDDDAGLDQGGAERGVLLEQGEDERDDGGGEEDEHELVLELLEDELPQRRRRLFGQRVVAVLCAALFDLIVRETLGGVDVEDCERLVDGLCPCGVHGGQLAFALSSGGKGRTSDVGRNERRRGWRQEEEEQEEEAHEEERQRGRAVRLLGGAYVELQLQRWREAEGERACPSQPTNGRPSALPSGDSLFLERYVSLFPLALIFSLSPVATASSRCSAATCSHALNAYLLCFSKWKQHHSARLLR